MRNGHSGRIVSRACTQVTCLLFSPARRDTRRSDRISIPGRSSWGTRCHPFAVAGYGHRPPGGWAGAAGWPGQARPRPSGEEEEQEEKGKGEGGSGGQGWVVVVVGAKRGGLVCTLTWPARSPSRQAHRGAGEARRGRFVHPPGDKDGAAAAATAAATSTRGGTRPRTGDSNQQWRATHRRQVPARDANTIGTGAGVVAPLCSAGQPAIR